MSQVQLYGPLPGHLSPQFVNEKAPGRLLRRGRGQADARGLA